MQKSTTRTEKQDKGIEFQLTLTSEQYEVLELLAKLHGKENVQEHIHDNFIRGIFSAIGHIEGIEDSKYADEVLETESSQVEMRTRIILHGFYRTDNDGQMEVIEKAAKAMEFASPKAMLEWAAISMARADLDQLDFFYKAKKMSELLDEGA